MRFLPLTLLWLSMMTNAEWAPPKGTDPGDVFRQAVDDRKNGAYANALEKHVWFHDYALDINEAYAGVRLSYNLEEWAILGKEFPAAKSALTDRAEKAKEVVQARSPCISDAFHDFSSINSYLDSESETVALFKWLNERDHEMAKKVFNLAFPDLLQAKEYMLIGNYIEVEKRLRQINKLYDINMRYKDDPKMGADMLEFAEQSYTYGIGSLIAVLVNIDRKEEANRVANISSGKINNDLYRTTIQMALDGEPPKKWP